MRSPSSDRTSSTLSAAAVTVDTSASTTSTDRAATPRSAAQSGGPIWSRALNVASNGLLMIVVRRLPGLHTSAPAVAKSTRASGAGDGYNAAHGQRFHD